MTKDRVSVAKTIELKDNLQNMGAQMLKEVASKTSDVAGDGPRYQVPPPVRRLTYRPFGSSHRWVCKQNILGIGACLLARTRPV